jgi:hypothetical protein
LAEELRAEGEMLGPEWPSLEEATGLPSQQKLSHEEPKSDSDWEDVSPRTEQAARKGEGKSKRYNTDPKEAMGSEGLHPVLDEEDEKLARCIDRIHAVEQEELTRGLLFIVSQQISEAAKIVSRA